MLPSVMDRFFWKKWDFLRFRPSRDSKISRFSHAKLRNSDCRPLAENYSCTTQMDDRRIIKSVLLVLCNLRRRLVAYYLIHWKWAKLELRRHLSISFLFNDFSVNFVTVMWMLESILSIIFSFIVTYRHIFSFFSK